MELLITRILSFFSFIIICFVFAYVVEKYWQNIRKTFLFLNNDICLRLSKRNLRNHLISVMAPFFFCVCVCVISLQLSKYHWLKDDPRPRFQASSKIDGRRTRTLLDPAARHFTACSLTRQLFWWATRRDAHEIPFFLHAKGGTVCVEH